MACCPGAEAAEGPTVAGPIGGTDIRSAIAPPPGLYGGAIVGAAGTLDFLDNHGDTVPLFRDAQINKQLVGPFLYYVPDLKVLGGSIGFGGIVPAGNQCGHLFISQDSECKQGVGDPYFEVDWARYFGTPRPSKYEGAFPILQGLNLLFGFGAVIPAGSYDDSDLLSRVLSIGTNIWDFAPSMAITYTTPPILAEGTEFSAKVYYNHYLENPATHYLTGDLVNIDFAISEHIGRFQIGVAGVYAWQLEDDELFEVPIPDIRAEALLLGPIVNYDIPESAASIRMKLLRTAFALNTVTSWNVIFGFVKKF
jgi:hypothetical protein